MVDLPKKKVGIVACSGEELAEGTVTRLAALKVLEQLRPNEAVTICLPLFLAGGEGDRAFARFYPTIAIDGCDKLCAARAAEMYSGKPAASIVVSDLVSESGMARPQGCRKLDPAGMLAVELTAARVAYKVDELLGQRWNRRSGEFEVSTSVTESRAGQRGHLFLRLRDPGSEDRGGWPTGDPGRLAPHLRAAAGAGERGGCRHRSRAARIGAHLQPHPGGRGRLLCGGAAA